MSTTLFAISCIFAAVSTILFAHRTGERFRHMSWSEKLGRSGVILFLAGLFVGLLARALQGGEQGDFEWFHYPLLLAGAMCVVGYGSLIHEILKVKERVEAPQPDRLTEVDEWLADIAAKEPCVTVDCRVFRNKVPEMRRKISDARVRGDYEVG